MKKRNYYVNVSMGLGGNIALSSVITDIKKGYGDEVDFFVMSPYWDVFKCNKNIKAVYKPDEASAFMFDAKDDDNAVIVLHRLYDMQGFIMKELSYKTAWYELFGLKPKTEDDVVSELDTSIFNMKNTADDIIRQIKEQGFDDFVIVNFEGGVSPLSQVPQKQRKNDKGEMETYLAWEEVPDNYDNEPLARHYPRELATEFLKKFREEHPKTAVLNYTLPNQGNYEQINGVFKVTVPYLAYYELAKLPECSGIVAIDSSLQHLIAGVNKAVILWGHSINADKKGNIIVNNFGYSYNKNIVQKCRRNDILYFSLLGPSKAKVEYIEPEELLKEVDDYLFTEDEVKEVVAEPSEAAVEEEKK